MSKQDIVLLLETTSYVLNPRNFPQKNTHNLNSENNAILGNADQRIITYNEDVALFVMLDLWYHLVWLSWQGRGRQSVEVQ